MSYSLSSNFVTVNWLLAELSPLNLYFLFKFWVVRTFFLRPLIYWLDIWYVAISRWVTVYVRISFRSNDFWLIYDPWTCIFVQMLSYPDFFLTSFDILTWYLVFWLYLDELQFKLEFRSGRMTFGWVMAIELIFLFKFEVVRTFLWRPLIYWLDIWYVAIYIWVTV